MKKGPQPPEWVDQLLKWRLPADQYEEVQGDMHELYEQWMIETGERKAGWLYMLHAFTFLRPLPRRRPNFIPNIFSSSFLPTMLINYFKIAFRNLVKNKVYSAVNLTGLTTGLAVGILILLWVQNERSYDRFHRDTNYIYRVLVNMGKGSSRQIWSHTHAPLATFVKADVPEIKNAVRIKDNRDFSLFKYKEKQFAGDKKAYVDASFFSIFDFKLVKGNPENLFPGDYSVVLTASTARLYFGDEEPIGKVLVADNQKPFVVSGVLEDFPDNSSLQYDMLFPMDLHAKLLTRNGEGKTIDEDWGTFNYDTFLQLTPGASIQTVKEKLALVLRNHYKDIGMDDPYSLQSLADMHLYNTDGSEGIIQIVRIFLLIGILILVVACINYINLSTARSMLRAKEVGLRKLIGAGKAQLFFQFIIEAVFFFLLAGIAALGLIWLLMPLYNNIADKNMTFRLSDPYVWTTFSLTLVSTLALSSIYPALLLSSFEPLKALKGKLGTGIRAASFRKLLVVGQFVVSVVLIVGTFIINQQLAYIQEKELGYDKEYVFSFGMRKMQPHAASVKAELLNLPGVRGVTSADDQIINMGTTTGKTDWEGKDTDQTFLIHPLTVDEDFLSVFKMQLVAGEAFTGIASDSSHYILNETAVREAGIINPIGKRFSLWDREGMIIGVVKDFHFASLRQRIEPAIFQYRPGNDELYVKTTGKEAPKVIAAVDKRWKQYNAGFPFEYTFLDETYASLYKSEQRLGRLFQLFSAVAILISCLGLFGLATYTAQIRAKEIGVRKVLGASVTDILHLLSKDFLKLVILAILLATPLAWYAMHRWLQDFAYRIEIKWWMLACGGCLALLIALLTVSFQAIKAAVANPVKSLRSE